MLNTPAPYANCSYYLQFYGPSISCGSATSTNATRIAGIISPQGIEDLRPFLSFVPTDCGALLNETDAAICGLNYTLKGDPSAVTYRGSTYDSVSQDHARIYVVVPDQKAGNFGWSANKTIECGLFNTSYGVQFSSGNGQLNLAVKNATRLNGVASDAALSMRDRSHEASVCSPDAVAYIALLNALGQQLAGYLEQSHYSHISAVQTQVDKTAFMDTKELYQSQYYMNHGTSADTVPVDAMAMTQALEEVFTNATLSLFSSTSFLYVSYT